MPRRQTLDPPPVPQLEYIAQVLPDGTKVTVADRIVEMCRIGVPLESAAGSVGVTAMEVRTWVRQGLAVLDRLNLGADWSREFTQREQLLALFADGVQRSVGEYVARAVAVLETGMRGSTITDETVVTDGGGTVLERRVKTQRRPADMETVRWRLERAAPSAFGRTVQVDLSIDLSDDDDGLDAVDEALANVAAKMGVVEVTGRELDPPKKAPRKRVAKKAAAKPRVRADG